MRLPIIDHSIGATKINSFDLSFLTFYLFSPNDANKPRVYESAAFASLDIFFRFSDNPKKIIVTLVAYTLKRGSHK